MLRVERPGDTRAVASLLARAISADQPAVGWDSERLAQILRRVSRWDVRAMVRLATVVGRTVPRTFVEQVNGSIRGAVAWSPGRQVGWVAALGLDPQGSDPVLLGQLLHRCWAETVRCGLRALMLPGSLVPWLTDPRSSLGSLGFVSFGTSRRYLLNGPRFSGPSSPPTLARPFRRRDAGQLARYARAGRLPKLEAIEPVQGSDFRVSGWISHAFGSSTASFVHDGAQGADAFVRATKSSATSTAHLAIVLDPEAQGIAGPMTLESALSWCRHRGARRAIAEAPEGAHHLASLLEGSGFELAEQSETWARPADGAN